MSITCPKCGSSRIHRSHRRTFGERLGLLLAAKMKRCHECNFRFVQLYGSTLLLSDLQRAVRKLAWTAIIIMALLAVLAIVVWFSNKQAAFSPSAARGPGGVSDTAKNVRGYVTYAHPQNHQAV
jgi:transposase-like protein